jgi:hypothetical protein
MPFQNGTDVGQTPNLIYENIDIEEKYFSQVLNYFFVTFLPSV